MNARMGRTVKFGTNCPSLPDKWASSFSDLDTRAINKTIRSKWKSTIEHISTLGVAVVAPTDNEHSSLWKAAYEHLKKAEPRLIEDLETPIKPDASIESQTDIKSQIGAVVKVQKERLESRQWSFPWFGKTVKAREAVDNIFSLVNKSSGIISAGMTLPPMFLFLGQQCRL